MSLPTDTALRAIRFAGLARLLSWVAMAAAAGVVILFFYQAGLFHTLAPSDSPPDTDLPDPDRITARESTVNGLDKNSQPYEVTAVRGWQDETVTTLVHMEEVAGKFHRATGAAFTLTARSGSYDTKLKELDLAGAVTIIEPDRFTAIMEQAHVVVEDKRLTSGVPVDVTLPTGTIHANGLEISDDGTRILFLNGVKARFSSAAAKGDTQP